MVEAVLPEGLGQGDQLLQQGELILQSLQGGRGGARLGLAIGQGLERLGIDQSIGRDGAAAEAEVLQLPLGVQVEGDREGRRRGPSLKGRRLGGGAGEQRQPAVPHAEGFAAVPQEEIEGATKADALGDGRGVHPEALTVLQGLQGDRRKERCIGAAPQLQ